MLARLAAILLLSLSACAAPAAEQLRILHFSDLYRMEDVPQLATALAGARETPGRVLVTHGGDLLAPSPVSALDRGAHMIVLMNAIGVELAVVGGHDFDFGPETLATRISESEFSWLSANTHPPVAGTVPGRILEVGDYRIGLFGLTRPETTEISSPGPGRSFEDPVAAAARHAAMLREHGVDLVIALAHLDAARDFELLRHVDVVLAGHDHQIVSYDGDDGVIVQAGAHGERLVVLDITMDGGRGGAEFTWQPEIRSLPTEALAPDPEILAITEKYNTELVAPYDRPLVRTLTQLDTSQAITRAEETAFGNLLADVLRDTLDTEIALLNSGSILGSHVYAPGTLLTARDILNELPYPDLPVQLEIPGSVLRDALENAVSQVEKAGGRFPLVSGLRFVYDPAAPAGRRVGDVSVGGSPLEPARRYTLATIDFVAEGGDGYSMFPDAKVLAGADPRLLRDLVIDHLRERGEIRIVPDGRIRTTP